MKTWTVTFMDRGATYETQRVRDGETASRPADPARTGYTFTGWYTDERCTHAYLFSTPVAADLTLYAGWQRKQPTPVTPSHRSLRQSRPLLPTTISRSPM
ncbi:MAG: InlB B-repeat-containing protein [Oscillospiraceae bacterium]